MSETIMKNIKTEIIMEASAALQREIEEELEVEDPTQEEAEAILKNESTQ